MADRKLSHDFLIYMLRTAIVALSPIVIFPYASRILGVVGIGRVQYIQSISSYFLLLAVFGISSYGLREGAKVRDDKEQLGKLLSELFLLNFITTGLALCLYLFTFHISGLQDYRQLLIVFSLYIIFAGLNLDWVFNVFQDYVFITVRTAISQLIAFAVLFLFLRDQNDEIIYALVLIIPYIGNFFWNFYGINKRIPLFKGYKLAIKQHILPIFLLFSIIISSSIYSLLDTTMLGAMRGDEPVGLYTAASKLTRLVASLTSAMCTVFTPRLAYQVGKGNTSEFKDLAKRASNVISLIAIPCAIGLWAFSSEAIRLFSGAEFVAASNVLKILSVSLVFSTLDSLLGWQILVPNNKDKALFAATLTGAIVDFVLNIFLIPAWNVEGAAVATLLAELSVFSICITKARSYINIGQMLKHYLKCIVAAIPIILIALPLRQTELRPIFIFCIAIPLSAIIYTLLLLLLREDIIQEIFHNFKHWLRSK